MRPRLKIGKLEIDPVRFDEAVSLISERVDRKAGGFAVTPNIDHVVLVEDDPAFREAYRKAFLSICDGTPLKWSSRLLDVPLPAKISGSDLIMPLMAEAASRRWRVYLLGAGPGVAEAAAEVIRRRYDVNIVGVDSPMIPQNPTLEGTREVVEKVKRAAPDFLLVAFGSPKQETWISRIYEEVHPTVVLGIGAGLDFVSGRVRRAPKILSVLGLEWFYRLMLEPRRLWRRYLVNDPRFIGIWLRTWAAQRKERHG